MSTRIFLIVLLICAGCATPGFDLNKALSTAKNLHQATADFTEPQEITLGQGIASNLLGSAPLLASPPVQQYINRVGLWLALQTERPDLPWQFAVLDDKGINAFAAPGGYIFITKGLLLRMKNEAELAGVLAHEMSHVLKKHHLQAIKKSARASLMADFAAEALQHQGANPALTKLVSAGTEIYARGLDKEDEFEADRMGVVIAARGGYDPYGLPAMLQILQGINPQDSGLALMFKTHPALTDRLDLLDKLMAGPFDRFEAQPDLAVRFMAVVEDGGLKARGGRK